MLTQRITRLEKVTEQMLGGTCPVCFGDPLAVVHEALEADPQGPGYRTGQIRLEDPNRIALDGDTCRCRQCGAEASVIRLRTVVRGKGKAGDLQNGADDAPEKAGDE